MGYDPFGIYLMLFGTPSFLEIIYSKGTSSMSNITYDYPSLGIFSYKGSDPNPNHITIPLLEINQDIDINIIRTDEKGGSINSTKAFYDNYYTYEIKGLSKMNGTNLNYIKGIIKVNPSNIGFGIESLDLFTLDNNSNT